MTGNHHRRYLNTKKFFDVARRSMFPQTPMALCAITATFLFTHLLASLPIQPRELGWYCCDQYLRFPVIAPLYVTQRLQEARHMDSAASRPRPSTTKRASALNRNHSFDVAFCLTVFPLMVFALFYMTRVRDLYLFHDAFRALL